LQIDADSSEVSTVVHGASIIVNWRGHTNTISNIDRIQLTDGVIKIRTPETSPTLSLITDVPNGIFRFFNTETGTHFYSASFPETSGILTTLESFSYEGVTFKGVAASGTNATPLFRFFNTETGTHFYTSDEAERDSVMNRLPSFNYEGVGFHINSLSDGNDLSLHRFFNTQTGAHFYTASDAEKDEIINTLPNFNYEGVVGYVDVV
jgi:hypothetical protein